MLSVGADVLTATFARLRACGRGREECVVYWVGPALEADVVTDVVQPRHAATHSGYEVDQAGVTALFLELRSSRRSIRAQVHTHPGAHVRHSPTDDAFPIAPNVGFISIVLPYFASGNISLDGAFLTELAQDGSWVECDLSELIRWT